MLEKGWLGGGNTGRNTTIIRSNYLCDESAAPLRARAQALGRPVAGAQLQRHVLPARRAHPRPRPRTTCRSCKRRVHAQPAERHRRRWLTRRAGQGFCPLLNISPRRRATRSSARRCSGAAAPPATTRSPGAMPAPPMRLRRRHHPELRGHGHPPRRDGAVAASRPPAATIARRARSASSPPATPSVVMAHGRAAPADRELSAAGAGLGAGQAGVRLRRDVERGARLLSASPTRASSSSAPASTHYISYSQRGSLHIIEHSCGAICELFPHLLAPADAAPLGRHRRRLPDARRSSARRRSRASSSTAAGAPAASRRRRAPARSSRTRSRSGEPHPLNAPFTLERFAPAPDRRAGGRRVAH